MYWRARSDSRGSANSSSAEALSNYGVILEALKRHEEALRRSEARYRSLVQSAAYGIYRASREGKFLDDNPALITMLGYDSAEEVLALDPQKDVFRNPEEQNRLMEECKRKGRLDNFEIKWKRKDENSITVRLSGRVVSSEKEPEEFLEVIAEDIIGYEARIRAARLYDKKLQERSRAIEIYREVISRETDPRRIEEATKRLTELSTVKK